MLLKITKDLVQTTTCLQLEGLVITSQHYFKNLLIFYYE